MYYEDESLYVQQMKRCWRVFRGSAASRRNCCQLVYLGLSVQLLLQFDRKPIVYDRSRDCE